MKFCPERLIEVRTTLNISKAEAARRLNISAMAYGRYEKGEREPSYASVCLIAQVLHCNPDFLYGISDNSNPDSLILSRSEEPEKAYSGLCKKINQCGMIYVLQY